MSLTGSRIMAAAVGLAIVLLVAGLTHFVAVLILPDVATRDAYTLLAPRLGTNHMVLLPPSRPGDTLIPFRDPMTVQGACAFDLTQAPVRIRASTEEDRLLTLSFRTPAGRIFYAMTDRAASHDKIDILLVTEAQLKSVTENDDEDQGLPEELRLKAPGLKGLVVATALVARPDQRDDAEARIKAVTCASEPLAPPS